MIEDYDTILKQRDYACKLLAKWVSDVNKGTSWDYWDENYKDAKYRDNPIRELLDSMIEKEED